MNTVIVVFSLRQVSANCCPQSRNFWFTTCFLTSKTTNAVVKASMYKLYYNECLQYSFFTLTLINYTSVLIYKHIVFHSTVIQVNSEVLILFNVAYKDFFSKNMTCFS